MPTAVPVPVRRALWRAARKGASTRALADRFGLAPRTVRHLVRRLGGLGEAGLEPSYPRRVLGPPRPGSVRAKALALRLAHPTWGSGLIRVLLAEADPCVAPPSDRTLRRWLAEDGAGPAPKGRRPGAPGAWAGRARQVHDVWQVDAADQVALATGELVSWLRITDERSGAVLATKVFPPGQLVPRPGRRGPRRTGPHV